MTLSTTCIEIFIYARLIVSIYPFPLFPQAIYLRERKCQRLHLNLPRGPPRTMKVRPRTEKVTLRDDSGHSPRGSSERDVG
jgi:hypothetical protein